MRHQFELFRRTVAASRRGPIVTIQRRGTISLNRAAFLALGAPSATELLFDAARRLVGFRPADPHLRHSYLIRASTPSPNGPFVISASAFVRHYGIDTTSAHRWGAFVENGVLCVDLTAAGTLVTGRTAPQAPQQAPETIGKQLEMSPDPHGTPRRN